MSMTTMQTEAVAVAGEIFPPGWSEAIRAKTIETLQPGPLLLTLPGQ